MILSIVWMQRELFLSEVNYRETIAAIEANNDTYWLQKRIDKSSRWCVPCLLCHNWQHRFKVGQLAELGVQFEQKKRKYYLSYVIETTEFKKFTSFAINISKHVKLICVVSNPWLNTSIYQTLHFFSGFIGEVEEHLKAFANSGILCNGPFIL